MKTLSELAEEIGPYISMASLLTPMEKLDEWIQQYLEEDPREG